MEYGEEIIRIVSALDLYVTQEIKKRRKQLNISQMELSVDMGFSDKLIGNMENLAFNSKFSIRHLNLAAKALECKVQDFFPEEGSLNHDLVRITILKTKEKDSSGRSRSTIKIIKEEPLSRDEINEYNRKRQKPNSYK